MKNKMGFTLVELLAVISILSILMGLAYMGVSRYLNKARNATYEDFEVSIEDAVNNYLIDHSGDIPNEGEYYKIEVAKLICEGYLDSLEDPANSSKTCISDSYALIYRGEDTSFNMDVGSGTCLKCSKYKSPFCTNGITPTRTLKAASTCKVR